MTTPYCNGYCAEVPSRITEHDPRCSEYRETPNESPTAPPRSFMSRVEEAAGLRSVEDRVRAIHPGWDDARVAAEVTLITAGAKSVPPSRMDAEGLARRFHEAYERLAPEHGYETRQASAKPWEEVPANNRSLMIAVCAELLGAMLAENRLKVSEEIAHERIARILPPELRDVEPAERDAEEHRCPKCGSTQWVSVSLDEGYTRRAQCVPCGRVHARLGPGWRAS